MPRLAFILLLLATPCLAAAPTTLPTRTVRIPNTTITFDMVKLPPGQIELAAVRPGQPPRIEKIKPIWIATTETTWDTFEVWAFARDLAKPQHLEAIEARTRPSIPWCPSINEVHGHPAASTTYAAAVLYCTWLSDQTGRRFRLPTEGEWEHACRAGGPALVNLDAKTLDGLAWHRENSATDDEPDGEVHLVGKKQPNPWGLYDMLGNVAEWVDKGNAEVPFVKGGSFRSKRTEVNSTDRLYYNVRWQLRDPQDPKNRWWLTDAPFVGFRVVCDDDPPPTRPAGR
ncbi:MAG: formylglycine-generating enzyme family protein [Tepidisphaerales bacterium]